MSLHVPATRAPRVSILVFTVTMALAQLGCMATVSYSHPVAPARLVAVSPGVWVVYDYPEAIFYSNSAYWWWNSGAWYTSRYADDGWVVVNVVSVPAPLRQVQRPQRYVHYRVEAQSRPVPRAHVRRTYVVQPAPQRARTTTAEGAARQRPRHGGTMGAVEHRRREPSHTTTAVAGGVVPPTNLAVMRAGEGRTMTTEVAVARSSGTAARLAWAQALRRPAPDALGVRVGSTAPQRGARVSAGCRGGARRSETCKHEPEAHP
jgi:hypothetical protein